MLIPLKCKRRNHLTGHISTVHEKIKAFDCEYCGKFFAHKTSVKEHIIGIHLKKFPHKCKICGKGTAKKSHLDVHFRNNHI